MSERRVMIVIGNGMVGHRFVEEVVEHGGLDGWELRVFGEERRIAYDRVHLSEYFAGRSARDLSLASEEDYEGRGIRLVLGDPIVELDASARLVTSKKGRTLAYDAAVIATGSAPFVPPIVGHDRYGCFVYRTLDDLDEIREFARGRRRGVVIGGGLLGLEAANALRGLGLETHVVEIASHLMAVQLDEAGGRTLQSRIEELGIHVHTSRRTVEILHGRRGPERLRFGDTSELETDIVVFSAGIRPRDELARAAGLTVHERGGIAVDDACRTSAAGVYAIGECASWGGRVFGLVAPGYKMAKVAAAHVLGDSDARFDGASPATELKLLGVDVASFGDAHAAEPGCLPLALHDRVARRYTRLVVSADGKRLTGGVLVGDTSRYRDLLALMHGSAVLPKHPAALLLGGDAASGDAGATPIAAAPDALVCTCNDVRRQTICDAVRAGCLQVADVKASTRAGSGCGGCIPTLRQIMIAELTAMGVEVNDDVCEHFPHTRQELYSLVRVKRIRTFEALIAAHGRGRGCEICKPAITSILAACWNEHVLDPPHAPLQDSNDTFLANIQRDGSYSVVPRVPAGEITPKQLIALGQVADEFDLYTKITGGQRIDLLGARVEQLPSIWRKLIDAGFESGHAYGKALRTVKSCVGSSWCRYGVQDSVGLAIRIEHRYKGLRAPHKIKMAVSGCTRECAEAQSKDVGVIATENGYNLYVCGNGGSKPRHADLFAVDLEEPTLIRTIDRFLMFYVRTADRLQRTARWLESLDGGLDFLRDVIIHDSLGIAAELEAEMAQVVGAYRCEWRAVVEDPAKAARFRSFVNTRDRDDTLVYVRERGQKRPARPDEIAALRAGEAVG
jgi:nitrite reductase (NADH) large subunit